MSDSNVRPLQTADSLKTLVERVVCPVCAASRSSPWRTVKGWAVEKCAECGMIFVNPAPTEDALVSAHILPEKESEKYFQAQNIDDELLLGTSTAWQRSNAAGYLSAIESRLGRKGRVLEIGCGSGIFLEAAQNRGWTTAGVDLGDWKHDAAWDRRLGITRGSLFDAKYEDGSFDAVFMSSVLEHLRDPVRMMHKARSLLKPGGLCYAAGIPNAGSFTVRLGVDRWIGNCPPGHLLYFSVRTVRELFARCGFTTLFLKSWGISETILEAVFNRKGARYTGSYADLVRERTLRGRIVDAARRAVYLALDATKSGSVLEIMGRKSS